MNLDLLERLWTSVQLLSHGCILCKYERVKGSPSQQAYKEKKDSMYALQSGEEILITLAKFNGIRGTFMRVLLSG